MGLENETMLSYLEDNRRFADLFNQLLFQGRQVVDASELVEASEVYLGRPGEKNGGRTRDVKKRLKSGRELKILAVESQSEVRYDMCQAIQEMMEDSRQDGIAEGEAKGSAGQIIEIIDNIRKELHCSLERACKVGGKTQAEYHQAKALCREPQQPGQAATYQGTIRTVME